MEQTNTTMKPTAAILENIRQASKANKEVKFTRLFRYMLRPDIYYLAYEHLYANNGAATKGVNNDTADGFSEKKVMAIIQSLRMEPIHLPLCAERTFPSGMESCGPWVFRRLRTNWCRKYCE